MQPQPNQRQQSAPRVTGAQEQCGHNELLMQDLRRRKPRWPHRAATDSHTSSFSEKHFLPTSFFLVTTRGPGSQGVRALVRAYGPPRRFPTDHEGAWTCMNISFTALQGTCHQAEREAPRGLAQQGEGAPGWESQPLEEPLLPKVRVEQPCPLCFLGVTLETSEAWALQMRPRLGNVPASTSFPLPKCQGTGRT